MQKTRRFSLAKQLKSFEFALNGLRILIKEEHNSRIHLFATVGVLIAAFIFKLSTSEWIAVIFAIGFVFTIEIINSAIENIADFVSPEKHRLIGKVKDLASAGVLVSAVTAFIVGLIIFIPKITKLLSH